MDGLFVLIGMAAVGLLIYAAASYDIKKSNPF